MSNTTSNSLFAFLNFNLNFFYLVGKRTNGNRRLVLLFTEIVYFTERSFHFLSVFFSNSVYSKFLALCIFFVQFLVSAASESVSYDRHSPSFQTKRKQIKFQTTKLDDEKVLRELIFRVAKVRTGRGLESFPSQLSYL